MVVNIYSLTGREEKKKLFVNSIKKKGKRRKVLKKRRDEIDFFKTLRVYLKLKKRRKLKCKKKKLCKYGEKNKEIDMYNFVFHEKKREKESFSGLK